MICTECNKLMRLIHRDIENDTEGYKCEGCGKTEEITKEPEKKEVVPVSVDLDRLPNG